MYIFGKMIPVTYTLDIMLLAIVANLFVTSSILKIKTSSLSIQILSAIMSFYFTMKSDADNQVFLTIDAFLIFLFVTYLGELSFLGQFGVKKEPYYSIVLTEKEK